MSESEFKNLKKWFWTFLLGQLFITIITGAVFVGSFKTTLAQHTDDIKEVKATKADLQTVLRIKTDSDLRNQMILDQLKELNDRQSKMYELIININKGK
jgi:Tfp pilus assembly protein PilO